MLEPEKTNGRLLLRQKLRQLSAERIEKEIGDQQRTWKLLLEPSDY